MVLQVDEDIKKAGFIPALSFLLLYDFELLEELSPYGGKMGGQ